MLFSPCFPEILAFNRVGAGAFAWSRVGSVEKLSLRRPQPCGSQATMVQGAFFTKGHHLFGNNTCRLGLGQSGFDLTFFDKAAHQVGEHRVAVLPGAAQLGGSYSMSHGLRLGGLWVILPPPTGYPPTGYPRTLPAGLPWAGCREGTGQSFRRGRARIP